MRNLVSSFKPTEKLWQGEHTSTERNHCVQKWDRIVSKNRKSINRTQIEKLEHNIYTNVYV